MPNPIITRTTDFVAADGFPAAKKTAVLSLITDGTLVDVTHDAPPQDVAHAHFVLGTALFESEPPPLIDDSMKRGLDLADERQD